MKVSYNGLTGELLKLERSSNKMVFYVGTNQDLKMDYDLKIYDPEKGATVSFSNIDLAKVKFCCGEVSFNG